MGFDAQEARKRARQGAQAQRLLNELAFPALRDASDRGDTHARLPLEPVDLKPAAGMIGRLHDLALCEALEKAEQPVLAHVCRKFIALGFNVNTVLDVGIVEDADAVVDRVARVRLDHLELNFASARDPVSLTQPLLQGVALPPAAQWRQRAEAVIVIRHMEAAALSLVELAAGRGELSCRIAWRDLSKATLQSDQFDRVIDALRARGFIVQQTEASTALRVSW